MPNIGAGQAYTSIAAWEADSDVTAGDWVGNIVDASEFNENVVFSGVTGTPSDTNRVILTVDPSVRHSGVSGTGHARIRGSSAGQHVFNILDSFTIIEFLDIQQDSFGASDEGIRVGSSTANVSEVIINSCIVHSPSPNVDQDGVYIGNWSSSVRLVNCIIYGFRRAGLHAQNYSGSGTQNWHVDLCTIANCGSSGELESGAINSRTGSTATNNITVYNTAGVGTLAGYDDFSILDSGTTNWSGSYNAVSDLSLTARGLTTGSQEELILFDLPQATGRFFLVNELASGSEDFLLLDDSATNIPYQNGLDRSGSEPTSRVDFSIDIAGNSRLGSTPDIGASEFPSGVIVQFRSLREEVRLADSPANYRDFNKILLGFLAVQDTVSVSSVSEAVTRVLSSLVSMSDSSLAFADKFRLLTQGLDIQELLLNQKLYFRPFSEGLQVEGNVSFQQLKIFSLSDNFRVDTLVSISKIRNAQVRSTTELSDILERYSELTKRFVESVTASDESGHSTIRQLLLNEPLSLSEDLVALIQGRIVTALLADGFLLSDLLFVDRPFVVQLLSSLAVADASVKSSAILRSLVNNLSVNDELLRTIVGQAFKEILLSEFLDVDDSISISLVQLLISWGVIDTELRKANIVTCLKHLDIVTRIIR